MYIEETNLPDVFDNVEIIRRFGRRRITHVFHDIDGTHSLIREWQPVMSITLHHVVSNGIYDGYDSDENVGLLVARTGTQPLEETDNFCIESAGLSALTQMEWAIRRAIEQGSIPAERLKLDEDALKVNSQIIRSIWEGEEIFDDLREPALLGEFLRDHTPRLFKLYEKVLNGACRDRNLELARANPAAWRVPGSLEFLKTLKELGTHNYFVTGAVIEFDEQGRPHGGMYEEVLAVGFDIGPGRMVEVLEGSTWDNKVTKSEVIRRICQTDRIDPENALIVGDGRSEVSAGIEIGALVLSRLPEDATRQRQLHKLLGTHVIVSDFTSPRFMGMFRAEDA